MAVKEGLDEFLDRVTKSDAALRAQMFRIHYGGDLAPIHVAESAAEKAGVQLRGYQFPSSPMTNSAPRKVRIAGVQMQYPAAPTSPVKEQLAKVFARTEQLLEVAASAGVNVVCLQEVWTMPFAFCTREKIPWCEFAESAEDGPSFHFLSKIAKKHGMVIVSPILERDRATETIWNTAVVISEEGTFLGKSRKNHIPRVGDFNESTYYMESTLGHPVFETKFGRLAVNICYGRHHPLNWLMYGLNGAQIVFNPSATVDSLSEALWPIEARNAAIANSYFTVAINRVGTEKFANAFTSGDGTAAKKELGHFFGSSYITAPNGVRTMGLSRTQDGIVFADVDLNSVVTTHDWWGFRMTQRIDLYAKSLMAYARQHRFICD